MPAGSIVQLICGLIALALLWSTRFIKSQDEGKKRQDAIDKDIDNAGSFDDFVRLNDELHDSSTPDAH